MNIRNLLFLVLLCLAGNGTLYAQRSAEKQRRQIAELFYAGKIADKHFYKELRFTNISGIICIEVTINGKIHHFIFDSGAITLVDPGLLAAENLTPAGAMEMADAADSVQRLDVYKLPSFSIAGVTFKNVGCMRYDFSTISKTLCTQIDGLIGANAMRMCYWELNMADTMLALSDKAPGIPAAAIPVAFQEYEGGGMPLMPLHIGDTSLTVTFDTGNNTYLQIDSSVFSKITRRPGLISGNGVIAHTVYQVISGRKYRFVADSLWLGKQAFTNEPVDVEPGQILLGTAFLKNKKLIMDWNKHVFYFSLQNKQSLPSDFGFRAEDHDGKLTVNFLWENSPAAKAGMHIGDVITSVNGVNDPGTLYCSYRKAADASHMDIRIAGSDAVIHLDK